MKNLIQLSGVFGGLLVAGCVALPQNSDVALNSPDGSVRVSVSLNAQGAAEYQVFHDERAVLEPSDLGIRLQNAAFEQGLSLTSASEP
ncbi:glycoside hydrolase family 97 N-terminal domain-containing protein, partial [Marinimicrobium sp. UBA4509]